MDGDSPLPDGKELLAHVAFVRRLAGRLVRDPNDADDVAQDALLGGWRRLERPRAWRAWLAGTVRNVLRMRVRSETRLRERQRRASLPASADPAQVLAQMEIQRRVVDAVLGLREPYRGTIVLRYFNDLTPAEIAALSRVPAETVRTRLNRAHALLRERLDRIHSSREAWAALILPSAKPSPAALAAASASGAILMAANTKAAIVLCVVVAGSLGFWAGTEVAAAKREGAGPDRPASRDGRADAPDLRAGPGLRAHEPRPSDPTRLATQPASPAGAGEGDAKSAPADASAGPGPEGAKLVELKNPLDEIDWRHFVPVLAKYGALGRQDVPPEDVSKELETLLASVSKGLKGSPGRDAEDLFRTPEVASRLAVAAAEHFGATLSPEQRASLRAQIEKAATEETAARKDALGIELMAETLQTVARTYSLLARDVGEEKAASVAGLLAGLLQDRGWGTLDVGPTDAAGFEQIALQIFEGRATLESRERADTSKTVRDWWERAGNVMRDAARTHGDAAARAAVLAAADDDAGTARARAAPTFPGTKVLVWAALVREQAVAERAFHDLWQTLPEDRRKPFDRVEPALVLFWPTGP